jgi:TPR repeat protein
MSYYRKAAALGNPLAMHKLGMILLQGLLNQTKNEREAITWLKRASNFAEKGHPQPLHDLAQCHEPGRLSSNSLLPDESYALELYSKAAELGYAPSQYRLGTAFEFGQLGYSIDPKASIHWYRKAADQGFPEAELAMSGWFLTGAEAILPQSDTEAYLWARRAAEQGLLKAIYAVGYYSENGIGVRADLEEAKRWYLKASKQGHAKSTQRLMDLRRNAKTSGVEASNSAPYNNVNKGSNVASDNGENCCIQ